MTSHAGPARGDPGGAADGPLGSVVQRTDEALADFLDSRARYFAVVGPELSTVVDATRRFVLDGGELLRPRFAYWGWRSVADPGVDDSGIVPAAASLELLRACALVHDDVMDGAATRRGEQAMHVQFAALHRANHWSGDAQVFGTAAAILIGDLLLAWADAMFAGAHLPAATGAATRAAYDQVRQLVMAGQYLDALVKTRGEFSTEEALRVVRFKTSTYTVEGPLRLGAIAAGASPEVLGALSAYGTAIGEAFQLRDDVLGVFGDASSIGKRAGDDLRWGKRTLLVALAMQAASAVEAELLRHELGDRGLSEAGVAALREVIVRTGALDQVEQRIVRRITDARAALQTGAINEDARTALENLAIASTDRVR